MRARGVVIAAGLALYGVCLSTIVDAAVVCRTKKGVLIVREDACKKKETAVDLTQFVATTTTVASTTTSTTLGHVFISGTTFSADSGLGTMSRQVIGCVNQIPLGSSLRAPVHLPQGATLVAITLFTFDDSASPTVGVASLLVNDGAGGASSIFSATSQPNVAGYQQNDSAPGTWTIDNANTAYEVDWRKSGDTDSPILSLCGVRVTYQPPAAP